MDTESPWTLDSLQKYTVQRIDDLVTLLDERHQAQIKATEAAFVAQQSAMRTAFDAADKAVQAALTAVEKASDRAEGTSDKKFESVNEFRGQLADQAANFIGRAEYSVQHKALEDRVTSIQDRVIQLELRLTSRLDLAKGNDAGAKESEGDRRLDSAAIAQWAAMALIGIGVIVSIVIALLQH
jgi:hypothetical protein